MKTRTKILSVLVALLPAALAVVAVKLEDPRELVQLESEAQASDDTITFLDPLVVRPDRSLPEAVRYELGLSESSIPHHRHHHRGHNVSFKSPVSGVGARKVSPCVRRNGITICDPKAHTRTPISRRPRRHRSWYLPERSTNELKPFGTE